MKISQTIMKCSLIIAFLFCSHFIVQAQTGQIVGRVTDSETGNALPGANIFLKGTSIGAASDIDGYYVIPNVPPGTYNVTVRYIGYEEVNFTVQVGLNERVKRDVKMKSQAVKGQEVIVTAQAEAQLQAINQQLSAKTIKNIVSKKQIQELPEANAAEAVGRLPGVSLERSGGEGTKVHSRQFKGISNRFYKMLRLCPKSSPPKGGSRPALIVIAPYFFAGLSCLIIF